MSAIIFSEPSIYKDQANKKWCVRYTKKVDGTTSYIKEYGKSYNIRLNAIPDLKKRDKELDILLELVKQDLEAGVSPEEKERIEEQKRIEEIEESQAYNFDEVLKFVIRKKGFDNPLPNQKHSKRNLESFWTNTLKPFLEDIGKANDVRKVTIDDIEKLIELKSSPQPQFHRNGKIKIDKATGQQLVKADWSYNTASNRIDWLGMYFQALVDSRKLAINPCHNIKRDDVLVDDVKGTNLKRFQIFTREELDLLWDYLENRNYYDYAFARMIYFTFIRPSEILRLRLWMLDLKNNKILIPPHIAKNGKKVKKTLEVYVPPVLATELEKYLNLTFGDDLNPDYLVFPAFASGTFRILGNKERSITSLSECLKDHLTRLRKIHPNLFPPHKTGYGLKHSGNTYFIENNFNTKNMSALKILTFLRKQNRHSDLSMTQKYISEELGIMLDQEDNAFVFD
ncbi:MAG TPA: site-specific integrase [Flavobacterium sp.]|jgi:integrase